MPSPELDFLLILPCAGGFGLKWNIQKTFAQENCLALTFIIEDVDLGLAGAELEKDGETVQRVVLDGQVIASLSAAGLLPGGRPALQEVRHQAWLVVVYSDVERSLTMKNC